MKLEKIEQKMTKANKPYHALTISGKTYGWFDGVDGFSVGDNVECSFKQNGEYTNLVSIRKTESSPEVQHSKHDVVMTKMEKPHSYEFGKPNNRHKIYYEGIDELQAHLKLLKFAGLIDEDEAKQVKVD